jgi:hypothetical protein
MEQHFIKNLKQYHNLFDGGRCSGWELEELLVKAIQSDTSVNHHTRWQEKGHDDLADITINDSSKTWHVNVKSGEFDRKEQKLTISGHRLGRYGGDLGLITNYLNNHPANMISVPYVLIDDNKGRHHRYRVGYIDCKDLQGIDPNAWKPHGKQFVQNNSKGVYFSLRPTMSWQIWWVIPSALIQKTNWINIT